MPTRRPRTERVSGALPSVCHLPERAQASCGIRWRETASQSMIAVSATSLLSTSGVLVTVTPRRARPAASIES